MEFLSGTEITDLDWETSDLTTIHSKQDKFQNKQERKCSANSDFIEPAIQLSVHQTYARNQTQYMDSK